MYKTGYTHIIQWSCSGWSNLDTKKRSLKLGLRKDPMKFAQDIMIISSIKDFIRLAISFGVQRGLQGYSWYCALKVKSLVVCITNKYFSVWCIWASYLHFSSLSWICEELREKFAMSMTILSAEHHFEIPPPPSALERNAPRPVALQGMKRRWWEGDESLMQELSKPRRTWISSCK